MRVGIVLLFLLGACGGPSYQVVSRATPNPFVGACQIRLTPLSFDNMKVGAKPEAKYLAEKDAKTRANHASDKKDAATGFASAVTKWLGEKGSRFHARSDGQFVLWANADVWEPGYEAYVSSKNAEVKLRVRITDRKGKVLDDFIVYGIGAALYVGTHTRMRWAAEDAGRMVVSYLYDRQAECAP